MTKPVTKCASLALLAIALGCRAHEDVPVAPAPSPVLSVDPHSFANLAEVRVRHLELDLEVDFETRRLTGQATLTLAPHTASRLVLDTRDLEIDAIVLDGVTEASFSLGPPQPLLGQALEIELDSTTRVVGISYRTSPRAEALQWLTPEQTAGGAAPFLFSQSQAILARTWVPCQDSPAVRMTYEATIRVPQGLMALMSATNPIRAAPDGIHSFSMPQPIPSYLLALAVGDLEFRSLGPRSGVYAEPSIVDDAAWEFADTETMIETAEGLYGPYRWERYDMLVLPPSFPFGGMENPRLTFVTPTILAGDRSLVALVAHELAHSWSGNLVTNATWNDFWLNEGFTSYIENRLMEEIYGVEYAHMLTSLGLGELRQTMRELGPGSPDSHLVLDLAGRDPDEGMTDVAYEKGANFLRVLEAAVGRERFDRFLKAYFDTFSFQSIDTDTFLVHAREHLLDEHPELEDQIWLEEWLYGSGIPASLIEVHPVAFDRVEDAVYSWATGTAAADLDTGGWTTHHWLHFLRTMPSEIDDKRMAELDAAFAFTESGNAEILSTWLLLSITHRYAPARPALERFLLSVGRRKFLQPLYEALADSNDRAWAHEVYARSRPGYHPLTVSTIDPILDWVDKGTERRPPA
ncbi:MAG: M1 family metallopeptidase [Acidobacteriota bacterium]|nr:M1 family metallopeptidase [Acidobacteriota bacterium]